MPDSTSCVEMRPGLQNTAPLSFAQERLWFLSRLDPANPSYNLMMAVRCRGVLDPEGLHWALNEVVRRHEVLRTVFSDQDGISYQRTMEGFELEVVRVSLREDEMLAYCREQAAKPFDLARTPAIRAALVSLGESDHVLQLVIHHLLSDGWSLGILFKETVELYSGFTRGEASPLKPLRLQYRQFAMEQRSELHQKQIAGHLAYWKQQGQGIIPLDLPTDRPRRAVLSYPGRRFRIEVSPEIVDGAMGLTRQEGLTLFMVLVASFQLVLARYSGQEDIVVGTPAANRSRPELEEMIGCFVNNLMLRTNLSGDPTVRELLGQVRDMCLGAFGHQDLPFEQLVEELNPQRDLSRNLLFQAVFALQNAPAPPVRLSGLELEFLQVETDTAQLDLELSVWPLRRGFGGWVEYRTDLFDHETVLRLVEHWKRLLKDMADHPERRLSELEMLSPSERQQVLAAWNQTYQSWPPEQSAHKGFEAQVERTPQAIAVMCGEQQWSYADLNERANQWARHLRELGVEAEVRVGLCVERGPGMVVGILSILKAGGAYVPLDPGYPSERLSYMLEDAQIAILLTEQRLLGRLPVSLAQVVCLDADEGQVEGQSGENLGVEIEGENAAYVIYTSGSTGRAKGVVLTHRGLVNLARAQIKEFVIGEGSRVLQFASLSFDAAVSEWSTALLSGGSLVVEGGGEEKERGRGVQEVKRLAEAGKVSVVTLPPSVLGVMEEEELRGVETLVVAGEACWGELVRRWAGGRRMLNAYGPTETTVCATISGPLTEEGDCPIGRPMANMQVYVLDEYLQPVAVGVPGELWVGGVGLARGYMNRPELTAERFVPNPYSHESGERLYRTGDRVRWRRDGTLDFLGRVDDQVKVRGYRIELGEIEAALLGHTGVKDALVIAREDRPGENRLVAYFLPSVAPAPSAGELKVHLQRRLPEHMVPASYVELQQFPLTPSGKHDRHALPAPEQSGVNQGKRYVAPRNPVEELLCSIWADRLGVEVVGIQDNFFDLGGHSLLATQVLARVHRLFGLELELKQLFEQPTVAGLAAIVEAARRGGEVNAVPPLMMADRNRPLPLSFAQQRLWFLNQLNPGSTAYNLSSAVRLLGRLDVKALDRALGRVISRHEVLRSHFTTVEDQAVQVIETIERPEWLEQLDLSDLPGSIQSAEVERLSLSTALQRFDLGHGALLRARLLVLGEQEHVLLVTLHHIIGDGWSMGVLVREMAVLYAAFVRDEEPNLAELKIQYADYAVWQREWLQGEVLDKNLEHWRKQLSNLPILELPTDHPRPVRSSHRGSGKVIMIAPELVQELRGSSQKEGVTLFMSLLASFQLLMVLYSGQDDVAIGTPVANRKQAETEEMIGFFVNTLVLRTNFSGDPTMQELLGRVRDACLDAYAHEDLPFERLVEELNPERFLNRTPLFQVMFGFQEAPVATMDWPELRLEPMGVSGNVAKFDLSLSVSQSENGLSGWMTYDAELFEPETVGQMLAHWQRLLEQMASFPERRISELKILSEAERQRVLVGWNNAGGSEEVDRLVHVAFAAQAAQSAEAVAAIFQDEELRYAELNKRANQVAHRLQKLGVKPEVKVGLCVERGFNLVVGLLGILKAGGVYVPLDPGYPAERLTFMIEHAQAAVLLTEGALMERVPFHQARVVWLDKDLDEIEQQPSHNPVSGVTLDNAAYIIYTSGSTGQPKGVVVSHRALANTLIYGARVFELSSGDTMAALASFAFDIALLEMLAPLLAGATLIIAGRMEVLDIELLVNLLQRVTVLHTVPSLMKQIIEFLQASSEPNRPERLRSLLIGGDVVPADLLAEMRKEFPACLIRAMYGPTETAIICANQEIVAGGRESYSPIGRPFNGMQVYVLNQRMEPIPIGVAGELYIGGAGVARGYLDRPELTARAFVPSPVDGQPGARLYRTGDLGRWCYDGTLEFLGRADHQVKVRGFRVEPGEIEMALRSHPDVEDAVVVAREDESGQKALVAYVVTAAGEATKIAELKGHIRGRLPEYMVPGIYVQLERLPLSQNGKLDRRALPEPSGDRPRQGREYVAPRTPEEQILTDIWTNLLGLERVGVEDNFFELGGHSLLATQLVSQIQRAFSVRLSLREVFDAPILEAMMKKITQEKDPTAISRYQPTLAIKRDLSMTQMLANLETLSEEEVQALLSVEDKSN